LKWADLRIRNYQLGFIPAYDVLWPTQIAIDTDQWKNSAEPSESDGRNGEVIILHAPNHRRIKGTERFEQAVDALRGEGLEVDLHILERRPNEEIRAAVLACDIVADQCLLPGYAMFSIEAMATGRPVLANISALPADIRESDALRGCPVVDTNSHTVRDDLRRLVEDPALRRKLGTAGREWVEQHHSYEAAGREWDAILSHVWRDTPLPNRLLPPTDTV
jgi:glycosyltransferase involved in cell wall biosynthesis